MATITLSFDDMNVSVQVGDIAYYSYNISNVGGFNRSTLSTTKKLGPIVAVNENSITVEGDTPPANAFISFAKDKKVNTSSLLGYYADIKFVNDSTEKIELFSVGSEIAQSSK
jgi:hypothetical protein